MMSSWEDSLKYEGETVATYLPDSLDPRKNYGEVTPTQKKSPGTELLGQKHQQRTTYSLNKLTK